MQMSNRAAGLWLLGFTVGCWLIAAAAWYVTGTPSVLLVATAGMFTAMLVAWPLALGLPVNAAAMAHPLCRQCASALIPGFKFCLHCGAYPKAHGA